MKLGVGLGVGALADLTLPKPPVAGPLLWVAGDLSGHTIATGVSKWNDVSGNGNDLVQATGSKQPLFISSAINGLPALRWDGSNDTMAVSFASNNNPQTVCAVLKQITQHAGGANDQVWDSVTGTHVFLSASDIYGVSAGTFIFNSAALAITSYKVVTTKFGTSALVRVAGVDQLTGNCGTNSFNGFTLGSQGDGTRNTNIEVAELLVYDSNLSAPNLALVENYLATKYGL